MKAEKGEIGRKQGGKFEGVGQEVGLEGKEDGGGNRMRVIRVQQKQEIDCSRFIQAAGVQCLWVLECLNGLITCTDLPTATLASKTNWACAVIPHPLSVCLWGRPTLPLSLLALLWLLCTVLRHLTLSPHCVLPEPTQPPNFPPHKSLNLGCLNSADCQLGHAPKRHKKRQCQQ